MILVETAIYRVFIRQNWLDRPLGYSDVPILVQDMRKNKALQTHKQHRGENKVKPAILGKSNRIHLMQVISSIFGRLRVLWVMLLASVLLSGCVQYDVGVNFEGQHRGEIVQHIKLGEQLTTFSSEQAQEWLDSIQSRTRQLQGKVKRVSKQEMLVTIPFYTGTELEEKFNKFFNPVDKQGSTSANSTDVNLPEISSHLSLSQGNFIFWVRNRLIYDLDLRSLGVISSEGNLIVSPSSLFDLEFSLKTPGGAKSIDNASAIAPVVSEKGHQLVWQLQPGQLNHLEVVFWLPSPLGIGTLLIALFVAAGIFLKERMFPEGLIKRRSSAVPGV